MSARRTESGTIRVSEGAIVILTDDGTTASNVELREDGSTVIREDGSRAARE